MGRVPQDVSAIGRPAPAGGLEPDATAGRARELLQLPVRCAPGPTLGDHGSHSQPCLCVDRGNPCEKQRGS